MRSPQIFRPLRYQRFRRLWLGQAFSAFGNGITPVALPLLLLGSGRPAADLGWVLSAQSAGLILFVVAGGIVADKVDRVTQMAASDVLRLLATLLLATTASRDELGVLMVITFVLGVGTAMFVPASRALLPSLVPDADLQAANGLNAATNRIALIIGPPIGAFLVTVLSADVAFAIDSATFLISVLALLSLRRGQDRRVAQPSGRSPLSEALDGIRTVRDRPWAAAVIMQGAVQVLFVHAPLTVLAPLVLRGRGELAAYGWVLSLQTVGALAGALLASRWRPKEPGTVALLAMLGGVPVLVGLMAGFPVPLLAVLMIFYGAGGSLFAVLWASALQRRIPDSVLARVVSLDYVGQLGLEPVGLAITAPFVAVAGVTTAIWGSITALLVTTTAPFAVPGVRELGAHRTDFDRSDGPLRSGGNRTGP